METTKGKILVFARAPIAGKTKTRLVPALGKVGAARLHAELTRQTLEKVAALKNVDVELWCTPDMHHEFFVACAKEYGVLLREQTGDDLGQRMHTAFVSALHKSPWAILVGTDCPELKTADFEHSMTTLRSDGDAVLGPAADGGYVLIGLKQPAEHIFSNIPWGSECVAELTRKRMQKAGIHWHELPIRHDIDIPADLVHLNFDAMEYSDGHSDPRSALPFAARK